MAQRSEAAVVGGCMKLLNGLPRGHAKKVHGGKMGRAGEPDIDAVVDGRAVKVEVKAPGKLHELKPIQEYRLEQWGSAGAVVGVVTSEKELAELLLRERVVVWGDVPSKWRP